MWGLNTHRLLCLVGILLMWLEECHGIHCYYCSGNTYYDPNYCFHPVPGRTVIQECRSKTERCEKKLHRIDGWTEKIERGCSPNCENWDYKWTEDFKAYCCSSSECNTAPHSQTAASLFVLIVPVFLTVALFVTRRGRML